ncbi:ABC transporter substrate-binding protein, partial [Pseudomonas syringae pv. tagetis]
FHPTVFFKPTRAMNADDVLCSFQLHLVPIHPWHDKSSVGFPYFESIGFKELLKSVEKTDDYPVKFTLTRREAPLMADNAMA